MQSESQVNLSWSASTDNVGVTGYQIERCTGASCSSFSQIATTTATTYNNTGLLASTSYSYRVRATDAASNPSGYSNTASGATPDTTAPTVPGSLTATVQSESQVNLSWSASTDNVGVTGYRIERCTGASCSSFSQIATTTATTYNNTGLLASTSYSYRVRATDAASNPSGYSNTASGATPDTTAPTVPGSLTATVQSESQVNLSWSASTDNVGVTGYQIERCTGASCSSFSQIATTTATTYNNTGLLASTSYSYRVRATDAASNPSGYSNTASATTQTLVLEPAGWYAGDPHVHRSCGGSPETLSSMYQKMGSQNLAVISLLADMGNGEVQNPVTDLPRVNGQDDPVSTTGRIVHWDTEWHWDAIYNQYPHQALGGHVVALGLTEAHQIWEEYTYPIINWAHQQNGIAGFVHMQYLDDGIPQSLSCCTPIEYPVEVALGSADFISEDVNGGESAIHAYYRLLNTGFRPSFTAGTDYPCGVSELGSLLTYVQVAGGQMTYRNWIDGIAQGRTVISRNGHNEFLNLTVNNSATPGDEINLTGAGSVPVTITWTANQNLSGTIELVHNGVVVASKQASVTSGTSASLSATVDFTKSGWLAARRMDGNEHQVHTGAVFVTVNNAPVRASVEDAEFYVQWMDNLLTEDLARRSMELVLREQPGCSAGAVPGCEGDVSADRPGSRCANHHQHFPAGRHAVRWVFGYRKCQRRAYAVHVVNPKRIAARRAFAEQQHRSHLWHTHGYRHVQLHCEGYRRGSSHGIKGPEHCCFSCTCPDRYYHVTTGGHPKCLLHGDSGGKRRDYAVHVVNLKRIAARGTFAEQQHRSHLRNTHGYRHVQLHCEGDRRVSSHGIKGPEHCSFSCSVTRPDPDHLI